MTLQKRKPIRSEAILDAANGEQCTICGKLDGTTVFCHLNEAWAGKGIGQKADDIAGFFGCYEGHVRYDTPPSKMRVKIFEDWEIMRAMYRTIRRCIEKDVIILKS